MVLLDTHALIFDAVARGQLTKRAQRTIDLAADEGALACSDVSLWEVAMLVAKGRIDLGGDTEAFLSDAVQARGMTVLCITPEIAVMATSERFAHGDPADRIIGSTALVHGATLITADERLHKVRDLAAVW